MHELFYIYGSFSRRFNKMFTNGTNQDNVIYFAPSRMTSSVSLNRSLDIEKIYHDRNNPPCSIHPEKLQECSKLDSSKYVQQNKFLRSTATLQYKGVFEYYDSSAALFILLIAAHRTLFTRIYKIVLFYLVWFWKRPFGQSFSCSPLSSPFTNDI